MLDDMRKYVRIGQEALSSQGSNDVAGAVRSRAQVVAEQLSTLAAGFLEWSAEARASLLQELKDFVARQVEETGAATKTDLDALRARVERLEARLNAPAKTGGTSRAKGTSLAKNAGRAKGSGKAQKAKRTSRAKAGSSARTARSKAASSSPGRAGAGRRRASRGPR